MYQVRTYNRLATSKKYFKTKDEIKEHLRQVFKKTREFERGMSDADLSELRWNVRISEITAISSVEITRIDTDLIPNWESLFGKVSEIHKPEPDTFKGSPSPKEEKKIHAVGTE